MSVRKNDKKFRDETTIQIINKCIGLKDDEIKRNNEILIKVLKHVLDSMRQKDEFFRDHFQKTEFVGSFYKRTKIGEPEEFDVNLIIRLPVKYDTITFVKGLPGCTKVKLDTSSCSTPKWEKHKKRLSKWVSEDGYLNQEKFRQSIEGSFSQGIQNNRQFEGFTLEVRKSGPAFTVWINNESGLNISVDLVPALEFAANPPLNGTFNGCPWYAVPKPHKIGEDPHLNWRMSFFTYEKKILMKHGQLRPAIRHVKKLRDTQNWKIIPSYQIETLFMHYSREMESCTELAQLTGLKLFLQMLERLKNVCQQRRLLNFWDPDHNMIEAEEIQLAGIVGRLTRIIKEIESDPGKMADWLLTSWELNFYQNELAAVRDSRDSDTSSRTSEENGDASPVKAVLPNPNPSDDSSGNNRSNDIDGLSRLIISNLKLIRKDISHLQRSVDSVSNRLAFVEKKLCQICDENRKSPSLTEEDLVPGFEPVPESYCDSVHGLFIG